MTKRFWIWAAVAAVAGATALATFIGVNYHSRGVESAQSGSAAVGTRPVVGFRRYMGGATRLGMANLDSYAELGVSCGQGRTNLGDAASVPGKVLAYTNAAIVTFSAPDCGVSASEANANGWLLRNASGALLQNGYGYAGDLGNAAYAQRWAVAVYQTLQRVGADGTWIDNVDADLKNMFPAGSPRYPDKASWWAASKAFYTTVADYLRARGMYVVANSFAFISGDVASNTGQLTIDWWHNLAGPTGNSLFDGLFIEDGFTPQTSAASDRLRTVGESWWQRWNEFLNLEPVAHSLGAAFSTNISGFDATYTRVPRYVRATVLLETDPAYLDAVENQTTNDPWGDGTWQTDIGLPSGARYQTSPGVWRRDFVSGYVIVDSNTANAQIVATAPPPAPATTAETTTADTTTVPTTTAETTTTAPTTTATTTTTGTTTAPLPPPTPKPCWPPGHCKKNR